MTSPRTLDARSHAALPVGAAMHQVETTINASLVRVGELLAHIGNARLDRDARMPLTVGMAATDHILQAGTALNSAYRLSVAAHQELSTDKSMLDLRTVNWGDYSNTFGAFDQQRLAHEELASEETPTEKTVPLRAVA